MCHTQYSGKMFLGKWRRTCDIITLVFVQLLLSEWLLLFVSYSFSSFSELNYRIYRRWKVISHPIHGGSSQRQSVMCTALWRSSPSKILESFWRWWLLVFNVQDQDFDCTGGNKENFVAKGSWNLDNKHYDSVEHKLRSLKDRRYSCTCVLWFWWFDLS